MKKPSALPPKNPINDEVLTRILYPLWSSLEFGQEFFRGGRRFRISSLEAKCPNDKIGVVTFVGNVDYPKISYSISEEEVSYKNSSRLKNLSVKLAWGYRLSIGHQELNAGYQNMSITDLLRFMRGSSAENEKPFSDWWKGEALVQKLIHRYRQYPESFIGKPEDMALVRENYAKELSAPAAVSRNLILF